MGIFIIIFMLIRYLNFAFPFQCCIYEIYNSLTINRNRAAVQNDICRSTQVLPVFVKMYKIKSNLF